MTTQSVQYRSCVRLNCGTDLPTSVILCVPPEIVVERNPPYESSTIEAVMEAESCTAAYGCTAAYWTYTFSFDDAQLIEGAVLVGSDITGVICVNCFTTWVEQFVQEYLAATVIPTGMIQMWMSTTPPTSWLILAGGTIGSAFSGATVRANADTQTLYEYLWSNLADAQAPVSSGRGASAALDFAANKTITLPDMRQKFPLGLAAAGTGNVMAGIGGNIDHTHTGPSHTHTGPSHTHGLTAGFAKVDYDDGANQIFLEMSARTSTLDTKLNMAAFTETVGAGVATRGVDLGGATDANGTGATGASGTGATGTANPPFLALNFIIKL